MECTLENVIEFIKQSVLEEEFTLVAFKIVNSELCFGKMKSGFLVEPKKLVIKNQETLCQDLYDLLMNEFKNEISTGYSHSCVDGWTYLMYLDSVMVQFPFEGYQQWIYNRIREDEMQKRLKR